MARFKNPCEQFPLCEGNAEEAIQYLEAGLALSREPEQLLVLAEIYDEVGKKEDAQRLRDEYAAIGRKDQ